MKRDPKVLIIALPFMAAMMMLWSQLNKKANDDFQRKISMEEPAPPQANMHIDAGGSDRISESFSNRGKVTYTVDIDSTEGFIYLYDSKGRIVDHISYTAQDMPVQRTADVKKGTTTLEVTRTAVSKGTGEAYADISFTPDRGAVSDKISVSVLVIAGIVTLLALVSPHRGRMLGRLFMKDGLVREEFSTPLDNMEEVIHTEEIIDRFRDDQ